MGLHQRRRPTPIKIYANPVRRQEQESSSPDSPDSPGTAAGPDSPGSPDTTAPAATATTLPVGSTAPAQVSSTSAASVSGQAGSASAAPQSSSTTIASPQTLGPPTATSSSAPSLATALPVVTSGSSSSATSVVSSSSAPSITARPPISGIADTGDDGNEPDSPTSPTSSGSQSPSSSPTSSSSQSKSQPTPSSSGSIPTSTDSKEIPSRLAGASAGIDNEGSGGPGQKHIGVGAEAALITSAVLGFIALMVGAYFLYKRRKRRNQKVELRNAENGFAPDNHGSLAAPETVHIGFDPSNSHVTRSTNHSDSLFGGSHYQRPETVSTNSNPNSRIQAGLPTPNPFGDDPSRNKAFDQLRGRPRSTTLTDRGSWVENPFRDPGSDRFDPFGELQEKARAERVKYMQELKQEEMDRRAKEREQEFLEKERMGLGAPVQPRKGSGVTLDGVGVLDRSANERYR